MAMKLPDPKTGPRGRPLPSRQGVGALTEVIDRMGGVRPLARALGNVSFQAVSNWVVVPPARVLDVERVSGVSRYRLRPDVFGKPPKGVK